MIGIMDVEIQAANPSMPLYPMRAFVNSPTSIRVRNVPKKIGSWNITSVQIVAAYPDNTLKTVDCVRVGGIWVGTIEGSTISGKSENGFTIFASGTDENGNPVTGYVLGKGLIEILDADGTIIPDTPYRYIHLFDEEPTEPKEGDLWPTTVDDQIRYVLWQNGERNYLDDSAMQQAQYASTTASDASEMAHDAYGLADAAILKALNLEDLVPSQATTQNQLADKAFVNSSVQTATANFRGNWAAWADVPTTSTDYPVDYANSKVPTVNDYLVVQDASDLSSSYEGTWRFKYSGTWATDGKNGWLPEYQVNETPMTAAQLAAINSNITAAKVAEYDEAMTKFNYELSLVNYYGGSNPFILAACLPFTYTMYLDVEITVTITIENLSRIGIEYNSSSNEYIIKDTVIGENVFSTYSNGIYKELLNAETIRFNNSYLEDTRVLGFDSQSYNLLDRTINLIIVTPGTTTYNLTFPELIPNRARDFSVMVHAQPGTYSTTPVFEINGYSLMNADGAIPEIKTDTTIACKTIFYFSEIEANTFLVKGEQLEAITL